MSNQHLYNEWSATYDTVENKTRDLEKKACREILLSIQFDEVLELGAGTGKNTEWLVGRAKHVTAVDLSEEMQAVARQKLTAENVRFVQADITRQWDFAPVAVDLITCSLILEHIEDLAFVFQRAFSHLASGGHFYICELHPFKQYIGSKARFESEDGLQVLDCFTHNISDYLHSAENEGFSRVRFEELFDDDDKTKEPRLAAFLFRRD